MVTSLNFKIDQPTRQSPGRICWSRVDSFQGNSVSCTTTAERPCPVCDSTRFRTVLQFDQFQFYCDSAELPKRTDIVEVQCLNCFALYLNPCYTNEGFRVLFAEAGRSYGSLIEHTLEQIDWLNTHGLLRTDSRVLDAGCYDGAFLAKLPASVRRIGVDIDGPAIERGRKVFAGTGIEFICGNFESFRCDGYLDTITMFHVLEHLPKPKAALQNLRGMAHSGTRLVVEVPILENGATNDINGFFSVQHATHFTRVSLRNCLALTGWEIVESQEQPDYNGYRVIARAAEPKQEPEKDLRATSSLRNYLAGWNFAVKSVEEQIINLSDTNRCVIWGGGAHTEFLYQMTSFFLANPDRQYAIVDGDPIKTDKSWRGIGIYLPTLLQALDWSNEYLLISSYSSQEGMAKSAIELGVPREKIVKLYTTQRVY